MSGPLGETPTIAVTGSTGRLGGRIARRLAAAEVPLVLPVRDPARAPELPGAVVVRAAYGDGESVRAALDGVRTVLMVSAAESPDRVGEHRTFVEAAVAAGVEHVVYTSFLGAAPDATFTLVRDHWATEEMIRAAGPAFTFLRDSLYADFLPHMIGADGVIRGPAADGRVAPVALDDVADVAVAVLRDPTAHIGRTYDLTGPEALTLDEIAALLTAVTRHDVRYHAETMTEARASRVPYGAPDWQVAAWVSTYTAIAAGELAAVSGDVERLSGHPATPLAEVLRRALGF